MPECENLAVFRDERDKTFLSCWRMRWRERLSALVFGRVWVWVWSWPSAPPIGLMTRKTVFEKRKGGTQDDAGD